MSAYKIRVNSEAESKEAQELFFELGYEWKYKNIGKNYHADSSIGFLYADNGCITTGDKEHGYDFFKYRSENNKRVTLAQLRDLVVLKRNDVKDANVSDGTHYNLYQTSDNRLFFYAESANEWVISDLSGNAETLAKLKPITRDPALISGAEAFTYLIGGSNDVQTKLNDTEKWRDVPTGMSWAAFANPDRKFRLKPQTIKINGVDVPAPFNPKIGEWFYYLSAEHEEGYSSRRMNDDTPKHLLDLGAWSGEDKIKQVISAFKQAIQPNP